MDIYERRGKLVSKTMRLGLSFPGTKEEDGYLLFQGFVTPIAYLVEKKTTEISRSPRGATRAVETIETLEEMDMRDDFDANLLSCGFFKGRDESLANRTFLGGQNSTRCVQCHSITFYIKPQDIRGGTWDGMVMLQYVLAAFPAGRVISKSARLPVLPGPWQYKTSFLEAFEKLKGQRIASTEEFMRKMNLHIGGAAAVFKTLPKYKLGKVKARISLCADGEKMFEIFNAPSTKTGKRYPLQGMRVNEKRISEGYWSSVER